MNFKRKVKPNMKPIEVKIEPVIVKEIKKEEPVLCKAKGCDRYSHTEGFCANCARDLKLL